MQKNAVIRLFDDRLGWYPPGVASVPRFLDDEENLEILRAGLRESNWEAVFAAPAGDVRLLRHKLAADEKKHIARSLPFALEDQLATDVDALHFATLELDKLELGVAITEQQKMESWAALLAELNVKRWQPEPLLLPWREGEWCLLVEEKSALLRTGHCAGLGGELEMMGLLLSSLAAGAEDVASIVIYGQDQEADTLLVPESMRSRVQWRRGGFADALMLREPGSEELNLLQGQYAPRLPLARWWQQWRTVAAVFAVAVTVHLGATYADYRSLQSEDIALRTAIQSSYRQAFPKGAISDVDKQLRRQLDALRGSAQSSGFVSLMETVGGVIAAQRDTVITSINYNDRSGEMRLNIVAANYEAVESIRERINDSGLESVMESSSAEGQRVRARLRVGSRS